MKRAERRGLPEALSPGSFSSLASHLPKKFLPQFGKSGFLGFRRDTCVLVSHMPESKDRFISVPTGTLACVLVQCTTCKTTLAGPTGSEDQASRVKQWDLSLQGREEDGEVGVWCVAGCRAEGGEQRDGEGLLGIFLVVRKWLRMSQRVGGRGGSEIVSMEN